MSANVYVVALFVHMKDNREISPSSLVQGKSDL